MKKRAFLINVVISLFVVSVLASTGTAMAEEIFSGKLEVCSYVAESVPVTFNLSADPGKDKIILSITLESDTRLLGFSNNFAIFTPWTKINGDKELKIKTEISPAEQTVNLAIPVKYLNLGGDNKITFSHVLDGDYSCRGDCTGCRYFIKRIHLEQ